MIKPTDLRIGNWVKIPDSAIEYFDIEEIHYTDEDPNKTDYEKYLIDGYYPSQLEGIPLTAEILNKCGFVSHRWGGHYNDVYVLNNIEIAHSGIVPPNRFCYMYKEDEVGKKYFKGLQYLHQLQNIYYCLTGEELAIKL